MRFSMEVVDRCLLQESVSTLEYAHRAMNIKNRPEINENVNKKDLFKVDETRDYQLS